MCGICGVVDRTGTFNENKLRDMNQTMRTRGPDGAGHLYEDGIGIAMRRLSIIDLSHGWQPIYSEDKNIIVVQNGEIYNYKELRKELYKKGHVFESMSDTEVLVHGYEEWGISGLLEKIDGMFAFCIWDKNKNQLYLGRDRFGEKPLYYFLSEKQFIFSSQMLTVATYANESSVNPESLYKYFGVHFIPGSNTIYNHINKVMPGEYLILQIDNLNCTKKKYWELRDIGNKYSSVKNMYSLLEDAVKSRLVADVPVGVFLSGGLDSSIVSLIASKFIPKIQTFSMGFSDNKFDESEYAKIVAEMVGSDHHHFTFELQKFKELIPKVIQSMDEPIGDQAMLPTYWLCSEASRHVKVVLSGEGADELFGGYSYYMNKAIQPNFKYRLRNLWYRFKNRTSWDGKFFETTNETPSGFPMLTNEIERRELLGNLYNHENQDQWQENLINKLSLTSDPFRRATLADIESWLSDDLLMKFDKMAMGNSLEGRAPFLEPRLATAAFNLPVNQKASNGVGKVILREMFKGKLPDDILYRKKQGFVLPMKQWLAVDLKEDLLDTINSLDDGVTNNKVLKKIVEKDIKEGVNRERLLYAIYVYVKWIEHTKKEMRR